ncbi:uncharacterized protein PpBr36_06728 [Pyricularia pennisetigena]|uniref:uncharacterized protein n=1 Tax=Pyricularia pennisetigena TaxID=1578925 RepID=UPI00115356B8|nr:uncharacterized protein PpBr36_06728 [Pyricularia pennisetigena]TLS22779.1 hypothetical protein PpBr36_06728 [Pyricularia pennisetigena]
MRYYLVFFLVAPAIVSAQPPPVSPNNPVTPRTGGLCCSSAGVPDPTNTCKDKGLHSYCCTPKSSFTGRGCDGLGPQAGVGRYVQAFPPQKGACGFTAFIGCA